MKWDAICTQCGHTRIHHGDSGTGKCEQTEAKQVWAGRAKEHVRCKCSKFRVTKVKDKS